jgi:hypothetical protein
MNQFQNLIKSKQHDPKKLSNKELIFDHALLHRFFKDVIAGKKVRIKGESWSLEDLWNYHKLIVQEMKRRNFKHIKKDKIDEPLATLEFAQPNPSNDGTGSWIHLKDIIPCFGDFKISEPYIYIVGGICNFGKTQGDIDILIRKPEPENPDEDMPIKFRIMRMLPKKYWNRVHFSYGTLGPFTSYVPLYSLEARVHSKEVMEMAERISGFRKAQGVSKRENKIKPFRPFWQEKPQHGRRAGKAYTFEGLIEVINKTWPDWKETGVYVGRKLDGATAQIHKVGNKVEIYTEDGNNVTENAPNVISQAKNIRSDFVAIGELELWVAGKHQPRADSSGVLNAKKPTDESKNIRMTLYDLFYINGKDIHESNYDARRSRLLRFKNQENLKLSQPEKYVESEDKLLEFAKTLSKASGSEGAMFKKADMNYPLKLNPSPPTMVKFKVERQLIGKVIAVHPVERAKAWNYDCALKDAPYAGRTYNTSIKANVGDFIKVSFVDISTYNTSIKANVGDFIKVSFVDISEYIDSKTQQHWFNWWAPHVIEKVPGPASSSATAHKFVLETTGRIAPRTLPKKATLEELEKKKRFVIQHHWRGKSVHADIRFEMNDHLQGFTLADGVMGAAKEPVVTLERAKELEQKSEFWKVDWKTGEEKVREKDSEKREKIWASPKGRQPKDWLKLEGVTPPRKVEALPGGTKEFPGVFVEIDSGTFELGAQKPAFKEFFLKGKNVKGRILFRLVTGLKGAKKEFTWLYWKPKDQKPYALSARAIKVGWIPPIGESALPKEWEDKIPIGLKYWKQKLNTNEIREMIKKIRKQFLQEEVLAKSFLKKARFVLQRHWWKGQEVIRKMPVVHWDLRFDDGSKRPPYFNLDKNPLTTIKGINAVRKILTDKRWLTFEGEIPPGLKAPKWLRPGNPNKKIPAFVDIIDTGKATIISDEPLFMSILLRGKKLKGYWIFRRSDAHSNLWTMEKSKLPKTESNSLKLSSKQVQTIVNLTLNEDISRKKIAELANCAKSTVYLYQRKYGLI